ncbi:unnamed protein product [Polarella glacialis]|uniref:Uncharacterized protein n=1 Tax=Polarella glacialis TaxID=89957 RepID=A0A813DG92_POLGL|nr:unnamed protein product [Polarella glacialis]
MFSCPGEADGNQICDRNPQMIEDSMYPKALPLCASNLIVFAPDSVSSSTMTNAMLETISWICREFISMNMNAQPFNMDTLEIAEQSQVQMFLLHQDSVDFDTRAKEQELKDSDDPDLIS